MYIIRIRLDRKHSPWLRLQSHQNNNKSISKCGWIKTHTQHKVRFIALDKWQPSNFFRCVVQISFEQKRNETKKNTSKKIGKNRLFSYVLMLLMYSRSHFVPPLSQFSIELTIRDVIQQVPWNIQFTHK